MTRPLTPAQAATEQQRMLDEALGVVKSQSLQMRRCLDAHRLMDALKHSSAMLGELKTSTLAPKGYYELYMALFDQLRHLAAYLFDAHMTGRHHLADLYELVQYAGAIVPRLYLMLTVGAVFMRVAKEIRAAPPQTASAKGKEPVRADDPAIPPSRPKPANPIHDVPPVKELLKDMLDMALGVQHPVRGLFLRYYLTSMTRDFMPDADQDNFYGCRMDSIQFLLQNFVEMNKLWVRLQYMGHSREREQREMERRELKLLVGSNLLRLSQLEGLGSDVFANLILPSIMSEVVNCRDVMAQEYLMEVVIQVFPDDFHLHTLDMFLAATSQLSRDVNVKQTIMSLVNRFTSFARRAREEHAAKVKEATAKGESLLPATISGIPEGVMLFEIFWEQVTEHIAVRPEFQLHDVVSLLSSLVELSTGCYPTRYNYVDQVLGYAKKRVLSVVLNKEPAMTAPETAASLLQLLLTTLSAYRSNPLAFLSFPSSVRNGGGVTVSSVSNAFEGLVMGGGSNQASSNANQTQGAVIPDQPSTSLCGNFTDLLRLQPFLSRKKVAQLFIDLAVNASNPLAKNAVKFRLDSVDAVDAAFGEICEVLVKDNVDGGLTGSKIVRSDGATEEVSGWWIGTVSNGEEETLAAAAVDVESLVREISGVGKLVNLVGSRRGHPDDVEILGAIRNHVSSGGDMRLKLTIPPLIYTSVAVARNYLGITDLSHLTVIQRLNTLFQFANESIHALRESDTSQTIQTTSAIRAAASREAEIRTRLQLLLPSTPSTSLQLYLAVAFSAAECRNEEATYEAIVNAITTYEDYVVDSKAQIPALTALIGTLRTVASTSTLSSEAYDTITGKVVVHCGRLLKKVDQCRCLLSAGHLYWVEERPGSEGYADHPVNDEMVAKSRGTTSVVSAAAAGKKSKLSGLLGDDDEKAGDEVPVAPVKVWRDGKKVLECLQKALKIADSVLETAVNTELFVEILEQYIWFYESGNDYINVSYLNSLIDLIQSNINNSSGISNTSTTAVPEKVVRHFSNIVARLKVLKDDEHEERRQRGLDMTSNDVYGGDAATGFGGVARAGGRWTQLEL